MNTYTIFCQDADGTGTIWIEAVEAADADTASDLGQAACAAAWGCELEEVHVLGIAEGDVNILYWQDLEG